MPYCPLSQKQISDLVHQIQGALVEIAHKPPTAVMIHVIPNCHLFLNEQGDAAFFQVQAVSIE